MLLVFYMHDTELYSRVYPDNGTFFLCWTCLPGRITPVDVMGTFLENWSADIGQSRIALV